MSYIVCDVLVCSPAVHGEELDDDVLPDAAYPTIPPPRPRAATPALLLLHPLHRRPGIRNGRRADRAQSLAALPKRRLQTHVLPRPGRVQLHRKVPGE
jgi:hypothetical protein